ncbi:3-oxoacyl-[acyl-carrier-protein] synthase, mitochondrial [Aplysia californica]|uniref:3-oxoacyl-[acyl-carrier-protein] synthase n=1 Tax=Aplysia californica TaxID=6500 RepID=A0ABM0K6U6_APLCA|nr:3-oxoacyl-[acyl-carrier-protein] synthase, mitochondrial [Aplysia californica]
MSRLARQTRRVVVTGAGIVSCLGVGVEHVWSKLLAGKTGITNIQEKGFEQIPSKVAGLVPRGSEPGLFHRDLVPQVDDRPVTTMTQFCLAAAEEALTMAQWKPEGESDKLRTGVCIGTGMCPLEEIVDAGQMLRGEKYRRMSPWFIPRILINMAAGHVNLVYGFKALNHAVSTACTTGLHAVGDASRFISHGDADVIIAGGCEASVTPLGMAGFARMRALSTNFNSTPEQSSRPFDAARDGFVMSEGAAVLVLEELEHAKSRGVPILGEVLGYGLSCDANHVTSPCEDGDGARRCMEGAMRDAGLEKNRVGYINAHATSTPLGDAAESRAILDCFGEALSENILVSSTKGATGHLLGAAGSVEALFTLLACRSGQVPPTANLLAPSTGCDLNYVCGEKSVKWDTGSLLRVAITNSFGFGGTNASVIFSEYQE